MSLTNIGEQFTIYGGYVFLLAGIFGNGMNILIFSSVRTYRTTPCTFYFLVGSIHNIAYIFFFLTTRIISVGYGIELGVGSSFYCKLRQFLLAYFGLTSFSCSCLTTIDQFLATSRNAYLRRYSTIKWAHRIIFVVIIIWCLHGIPSILYINILPLSNRCVITNAVYSVYARLYAIIHLCLVPISIMITFGYLTYRHIRQTIALAEQHADRQFIKMIFIQVVLVIISISPVGIYSIYAWITSGMAKSLNRQLIESFVSTVFSLTSYFYYVGNFYMFLVSSSRFRHTVKDRILFWRRQNRVIPLVQTTFRQSALLKRQNVNE